MEGKGFFVLLVIVAFLSLSCAVLVGLLFFAPGASSGAKDSKVVVTPPKLPKDVELLEVELIKNTPFNLKNSTDNNKASFIQVTIVLSYYKEVTDIKSTEKIEKYKGEIIEGVSRYFLDKTYEEVSSVDAMDEAKVELKKEMNDLLFENEVREKGKDIIYKLSFPQWVIQ